MWKHRVLRILAGGVLLPASIAYATCWDQFGAICKVKDEVSGTHLYPCEDDPEEDFTEITTYVYDDAYISTVSALPYDTPYAYSDYERGTSQCVWIWYAELSATCEPPDGGTLFGASYSTNYVSWVGKVPYCVEIGE